MKLRMENSFYKGCVRELRIKNPAHYMGSAQGFLFFEA
jgi:hypothetical protein